MPTPASQTMAPGTPAPPFRLPAANPGVDGAGEAERALEDYAGAAVLVVAFLCNHCPYVQHIEEALVETARAYEGRGVRFVGISSNDPRAYPEDSCDEMARRAAEKGYPFPYLYDASQDVARAYGAACTPDFYVFDGGRRLAYHGRFDKTRPGLGRASGRELRAALDALLAGGGVTEEAIPSIGCGIKWRPEQA